MTEGKRIEDDETTKELGQDFLCGFRKWRPKSLQYFTNIHWFLPFVSIFSLIQGMTVSGLISASVPHIEREFGFTSTQSGILLASNDLTGFLFVLFVSYYGETGHKPTWLGIGSILTGLGAFIFSLPKIMKGPYTFSENNEINFQKYDLCNVTAAGNKLDIGESCDSPQTSIAYFVTFCIANMLMGVGTTPLNTLGAAYLDENVSPKNSPIYIGIWYLMMILGPSIGLSSAGGFLKEYTDPNKDPGNLTPKSALWVGRWWLPFATISWILVFNGFILMLFPKRMPGSLKLREKALAKGEINKDSKELDSVRSQGFFGFIKSTVILVKNKYLMVTLIGGSAKLFAATGISPFFPKFLTKKYGADLALANSLVGVVLIFGAVVGLVVGSIIMRNINIKESVKKATVLSIILAVINVGLSFSFIIDGCSTINLVDSHIGSNVTASCNANCGCIKENYKPVCSNGLTYLSPCYAGCKLEGNDSPYENCSCVQPKTMNSTITESITSIGKCDQGCKNLYVFIVFILLQIATSFIGVTPKNMITLRSVPANQRAFAMGLQFLMVRAFGMLPGPIVVGKMFDSACLIWQYDECGRKTSCIEYELNILSKKINLVALLGNLINLLFFVAAMFLYKRPAEEVNFDDIVIENTHQCTEAQEASNNANGQVKQIPQNSTKV